MPRANVPGEPGEGFPVDAFGTHWWFDTGALDPRIARYVRALWTRAAPDERRRTDPVPDGHRGSAGGRIPFVLLPEDAAGPARSTPDRIVCRVPLDESAVGYAVSRAFTRAGIGRRAGECVLLHALGLSGPAGEVVALVGGSGAGKTTGAVELGRFLGYVSDETVAVEPDLRVSAYPKPLSILRPGVGPGAKSEHSPDALGLRRASPELSLAAVVVLERAADVTQPTLEPIGLVDAALAVLPQTSALPRLSAPLARLAGALTIGGGPYRLRYREISECRDLVTALAAPPAPAATMRHTPARWRHLPGPETVRGHAASPFQDAERTEHPDPATGRTRLTRSTVLTRAPWDDAIASDGEVLLLRGDRPIRLCGVGALVWLAAERASPIAALHAEVVAGAGPHSDSRRLVRNAARELLAHDVLTGQEP